MDAVRPAVSVRWQVRKLGSVLPRPRRPSRPMLSDDYTRKEWLPDLGEGRS